MKIGVVGLGYVGLPLAVAFCEAGHEVTGVDTDARVVEALGAGNPVLAHDNAYNRWTAGPRRTSAAASCASGR
jgi:UDP-N-acetyl-D-mannosaminuronate dehydrogenase